MGDNKWTEKIVPVGQLSLEKIKKMRQTLSETPEVSTYYPVADALKRATELKEQEIANALRAFLSMPQSTTVFANPVLHNAQVSCNGTDITLNIRSFSIRGLIQENEIVAGRYSPAYVIFVGLFGRKPEKRGILDEEAMLSALIDRKFYRSKRIIREDIGGRRPLIQQIAEFVHTFPGNGPEITIQHISALRKAHRAKNGTASRGINSERPKARILLELIQTHMENVAAAAMSIYMNHLLRQHAGLTISQLIQETSDFLDQEQKAGKTAFQACYSCLLGRHASDIENEMLERMGLIQIHHGSAGSNIVTRYMATLHTRAISDLLNASHMILDGYRHFGAIHDMTEFVNHLEPLGPAERDEVIKQRMLVGSLPTFGHPEIAAAGRANEIQQDPRPALYLEPLFRAIDKGELKLSERQKAQLSIVQRIYQLAFVKGVIKPGREHEPPLRLTPNTDFGGWSVQQALGINDCDRTILTYIFRGFGWMMDAREQMTQKIIRPVIPPDPRIIPKTTSDTTIPDVVVAVHQRLVEGDAFSPH
jgi:hypothetical protein